MKPIFFAASEVFCLSNNPAVSDHAKGLAITALGVLFLTPDTLLIRLIDIDQWTMIFWRGALMACGLSIYVVVMHKGGTLRAFQRIGWPGLGVGLGYCLSSISFVAAVEHTSVANTLVIVASAPMFAALFSWVFLKERVPVRTMLAMLGTFGGIAIVLGQSLSGGHIMGDLAALGAAASLASAFVLVRLKKAVDMIPAVVLGSVLPALVAYGSGLATPSAVPTESIWLLILMGLIMLPLSFGLITVGPRYIPAPEVGLLLLLETVLGPFWVWLVIGEQVDTTTMIGGGIVILTLALNSAFALRQKSAVEDPGQLSEPQVSEP